MTTLLLFVLRTLLFEDFQEAPAEWPVWPFNDTKVACSLPLIEPTFVKYFVSNRMKCVIIMKIEAITTIFYSFGFLFQAESTLPENENYSPESTFSQPRTTFNVFSQE
jgi:hypothetical protein